MAGIDLIERLVADRLRSSGPLTADELCAALGVSRAYVRTAIAGLASRGEVVGVEGDRLALVGGERER